MRTRIAIAVTFVLSACALLVSAARGADGASDSYSDGNLTVQWTQRGDDYAGTFTLGARQFPATAHNAAGALTGTFASGANQFPFTGSIDGDTLTLTTGGKTFVLKNAQSANPLAAANPSAPAAATPAADAPAGYTVLVSTDAGKMLSALKPAITTIQAALESTLPDLDHYFGVKCSVGSAYQSAKDANSGGATFGSTYNGQPVKGIVSCKLSDKGAAIVVVFARAGTTKADWDKLMAPPQPAPQAPPQAGAQSAPQQAAPPDVPMQEYDFPDGTGSMTLAQGWTTKAQSATRAVMINGPDHEEIEYFVTAIVQIPSAAPQPAPGMGYYRPPPPAPGLVAPLTDPVEALKNLLPQFSKMSQSHGGPAISLDQIICTQDAPAQGDAKSAVIVYDYTVSAHGHSLPMRATVQITTSPFAQGAWSWRSNSVAAPRAKFDSEQPLMWAMLRSIKGNWERSKQVVTAQNNQLAQESQAKLDEINAVGQANLRAQRQEMQNYHDTEAASYQARRDAQQQSFAQHNQQWAAQETAKQQANADVIEQIQGTRMIYDTQTGQSGTASLYDVTGVVNSLNQAAMDPNRFVQVPLRDYLYAPTPVPGGQ